MHHLNEEQLTATLIGDIDADATAHLDSCAACRADHDSLARTLGGFRAIAEARAARPAGFWYAQRAAVAAQLGSQGFTRPRIAIWASAMAALTFAAAMLGQSPKLSSAEFARLRADHELLMEVELSVQRTVPRALAPANALAQEMAQAYRAGDTTTQAAP